MKSLIICISVHHGNTERVARAMAEVLGAEVVKPHQVEVEGLSNYDLIGFGSGIHFQRHHRAILGLVKKLPVLEGKKAFIFSTRGVGPVVLYHKPLRKKLLKRKLEVIGEFSCKGFNTVGPLKLFGGMNRGRPNEEDLEEAKAFAERLKAEIEGG
ncbi:MAG TPA: flavodoxin [Candidatus Latescibacteria bacterium]|nr:flavodoxin [Candidatus Latescibacterota bacterium]